MRHLGDSQLHMRYGARDVAFLLQEKCCRGPEDLGGVPAVGVDSGLCHHGMELRQVTLYMY